MISLSWIRKEELDLNPYSSIKLIKFLESFCSVETKGDNLDKVAITFFKPQEVWWYSETAQAGFIKV